MKDWLASKLPASKIVASGAKPAPLTTGASEVIEAPRVCAMFDKPWVARYIRGERGLFRLMDTVKPDSGNTAGAGKGSAAEKPVTLKSAEISRDSEPERCAWCGIKGKPVFCENCEAWVCRSQVSERDGKEYFRCRASCASEGFLTTTTQEYEGQKTKPPSFRPALPEPKTNQALPASTARAQLGPGDRLRRRP